MKSDCSSNDLSRFKELLVTQVQGDLALIINSGRGEYS
jgi:hypothetical protein